MPTQPPEYISFDDRIDGKQVNFRFTGQLPLEVREDRDGRLRIHDGRNEGWVDKASCMCKVTHHWASSGES